MIFRESDHITDDLSFFTRMDEPRRPAVMVAIADPDTRLALAHHLRGRVQRLDDGFRVGCLPSLR